jgi:hypothetical protein
MAAKKEIDRHIELKRRCTGGFTGSFTSHALDVEELADRYAGAADYVFTDPPYGGHISYLDLSTLWTAWLGIPPDKKAVGAELIVGGEMNFSEDYYVRRLGGSIKACVRMLKPGRWLSVVFQHWNVAYFEAILTAAAEAGAELRAAVSQVGDPIWSMHKKKGNDSVLAGEMILTFYNSRKALVVEKNGSFDVSRAAGELLRSRENGRLYGEALFNELIVAAWRKSAIQSLNISRTEFSDLIRSHGWHYDEAGHCWLRDDSERSSLLPA